VDYAAYWSSGEQSAAMIHALLSRHLGAPLTSVCEWGCGPGRVIRHLPACQPGGGLQVHGADYNPVSVSWCQRALPDVSVIRCDLSPPLPYQDGQFDAVYAISVFTHLAAERHEAWLQELLRIVRPGGLLLMTLHGDRFRDRLLPEERRQYDSGSLVVRDRVKEGSRTFAAFHSPTYVRTAFLRDLPVVWHDPQSALTLAGGQDVWIVRSP
jgi:SAM-dependent methyltransferase